MLAIKRSIISENALRIIQLLITALWELRINLQAGAGEIYLLT